MTYIKNASPERLKDLNDDADFRIQVGAGILNINPSEYEKMKENKLRIKKARIGL